MSETGIGFLLAQHEEVRRLVAAVKADPPESRQAGFDQLRQLLAVHETAEELILRPVTRTAVPGGGEIADARVAEENQSKDVLSQLEKLDASSDEFAETFASFAEDVLQHAHNEEAYEFPLVEQYQD